MGTIIDVSDISDSTLPLPRLISANNNSWASPFATISIPSLTARSKAQRKKSSLPVNDTQCQCLAFAISIIRYADSSALPPLATMRSPKSVSEERSLKLSNSVQYFPLVSVQLFPLFQPSEDDSCAA